VTRTAMGWVALAWAERGICRSALFLDSEGTAREKLDCWRAVEAKAPRFAVEAARSIEAYANGEPAQLDSVPLDLPGSADRRAVFDLVRAIPRGETRTYGRVAFEARLGAGAARAVGRFMASNPVPPFVPCHRVVGADGDLRGYAGGLEMKRLLLEMEGAVPPRLL